MPQIGGEQINRTWTTLGVGAVGLVLAVSGAAYLLRPAFRVKHPVTSGVAWEVLNRGSSYQSGSHLINLGGVNGTGTTVDAGVALEVIGTMSGVDIFASRSLTGTNIYAALRFSGAGLSDCDTAGTSKLLWDASTKRFSCGTDQTGGSSSTFGTGNVLAIGDPRYLKRSGGTMTGNLVLSGKSLMADVLSGTSLKILGTGSGNVLHAEKTLTSSGTITAEGTISGATFRFNTASGYLLRASYVSPRILMAQVFASGSSVAVGSGKLLLTIPSSMSGYNLIEAHAKVETAGATNTTGFQIRNISKGKRRLLSTVLSIDSGEPGSDTAAAAFVVNGSNDDVSAFDLLSLDVTTVSTTAPKGLVLTLTFSKP